MPTSPEGYPEEYYRTGNYSNYMHREGSYWRMAAEIDEFLGKLGAREFPRNHLDWGCGPGFFVAGMKRHGWNSYGYDPSKWAVEQSPHRGFITCNSIQAFTIDWTLTTCHDVLEHMPEYEIYAFLCNLKTKFLLVRIPVSAVDDGEMILQTAKNDPTHITPLTKDSWETLFKRCGFRLACRLNLYTIWDSEGVLVGLYHKDT